MNFEVKERHRFNDKKEIVYLVEIDGKTGGYIRQDNEWFTYPSFLELKKCDTSDRLEEDFQNNKDKMASFVFMKRDAPFNNNDNIPRFGWEGNPMKIISCSAKPTSEDTEIAKSMAQFAEFKINYKFQNYNVEGIQTLNNRVGLSEVYNKYITEEFRDYILIFVHDDVLIEDLNLVPKLHEAHEKYDIVGVAGCKNPTIKSPAYWHLMAPRQNLRGFCCHAIQNSEEVNMSVYGNTNCEVDLIDGVFMSVKVSSLLDSKIRFDEDFDFHFYDLAFCRRAKGAGLKIGVAPIFIKHFSPGGGNDRWAELEPLFINRYA